MVSPTKPRTPTPKLVYSPRYNIRAFGLEKRHPFDSCKFGRAYQQLRSQGTIRSQQVLRPVWPTREQLLRVHSESYLASLRKSSEVARVLELPVIAKIPSWLVRWLVLRPMLWATGGTIVAARAALEGGIAVNLSGGYHHASQDHGHGFSPYADIAIAIEDLRSQGRIRSAMIVDLDAHQGNGLERIYRDDPQVSIFDMFNEDIFPHDAEALTGARWEIGLSSGTRDEMYLWQLREALPSALDAAQPDVVFYNAGTDIFADDPLGLLEISAEGVFERDQFVFEQLTTRQIPWIMVLSGGYTRRSYELVARSVAAIFQRWGR